MTETTASGTAGQARADVTAADVIAPDGATTGSTGAPVTCRVIGGADTHARKSGVAHFTAPDEPAMKATIRELLSYQPQNNM